MISPTVKTTETSATTPRQKFEGHTDSLWGVVHLPGGQRIITCSLDGSLRAWNLKSGKQIGEDWRDGEITVESKALSPNGNKVVSGKQTGEKWRDKKYGVQSIALSPDGKKVVSGSNDGTVRLWDVDTGKVITKWTGYTGAVWSVSWSRDGQRVSSGSSDGTVRQWDVKGDTRDVKSGKTILASIKTGHYSVWAVVYSPDMTLIATAGVDEPDGRKSSIQIWDAKTGKLVATLKGHTIAVTCLAWTKDGKTLISGSYDYSIRTWNTTKWEQIAILDGHTDLIFALAITPNDRILASTSYDRTTRLWNLDNGKPISSPLQHAEQMNCVSFSAGGKLLVTGCHDKNAYLWDVAAIIKEAGLDKLLLHSKANKSALHANATRPPVQRRPPDSQVPHGFFDGVSPAYSSARSRPHSSELQRSTLLRRLFNSDHSSSSAHDTSASLSTPIDWARNLFKPRTQSGQGIELQGQYPAVVKVPYAKGKRRNASAREVALAKQKQKQKAKLLHSKNSTACSSQPPKANVIQPSSQPQAADSSSSITPATGDSTAATTSMPPSRRHAMIKDAGLWTRFWLFLGCLSPEYTDDHQ